MSMKGREEPAGAQQLGLFLQQNPDGDVILLRSKFRGVNIKDVPRGFIRVYVLTKWKPDMTPRELEIFEQYGAKDET